jgi:lipopolysaccharide export LptBFGC system permease protein LptF
MESLKDVLKRYSGSSLTLGATPGEGAAFTIDRAALQRDLKQVNKQNEKYFIIGVVMAAVLFVALIVTAFLQRNGSLAAQAVPPVLGSSAAVVVWRMFKTWREKSYTDCVLALVPSVDQALLSTIVEALLRRI